MSAAAALPAPDPASALQPGALLALLRLSLGGLTRLQRLLGLCALFCFPAALALLPRIIGSYRGQQFELDQLFSMEMVFAFLLVPHAVVPLACLLFGSGMINDEIEDQTLTYLLIRPLQRWSIYVMKLLAAVLLVSALCAVFLPLLLGVIWYARPLAHVSAWELLQRGGDYLVVILLAVLCYTAVFGFLSLFTRRILIVGIIYIAVFEGVMANLPLVFREFTLMYYLRVLFLRWLAPEETAGLWSIDLAAAPEAASCVATLLVVSALATLLGGYLFSVREFRLKTPEG